MNYRYLKPEELLIDVVELSKKNCTFPIAGKLAYASCENFMGRVVNGYHKDACDVCLLARKTAHALCKVQNNLNDKNLGLYIHDAYRPLCAVKDFAGWFCEPANDEELKRKIIHYPNLQKTDLAPLGYAPENISRHNFGNAVDLTLIDIRNSTLLDMGACFDYFDELSHVTATRDQIGEEAFNNRLILATTMQNHGFEPYDKEFWHFDYYLRETDEPMDMPIEKRLRSLNV